MHSKLLHKLNKLVLHSNIRNWICFYRTNRKFYDSVNGATSTLHYVISGILQGLPLGSLLIILYTYGLRRIVKFCKLFLFADDSKLAKIVISSQHCVELRSDLNAVYNWYCEWQLIINIPKNFVMLLCSSKYSFYSVENSTVT